MEVWAEPGAIVQLGRICRPFAKRLKGLEPSTFCMARLPEIYQIPVIYGLLGALCLVREDDIGCFGTKFWPPKRYLWAVAHLAQSYVGGNVYLRRGRRAATWYIRWRDRNGEHRRVLGPDWTEKGKPPVGHFRKREAEQALQELLVKARAGEASRVRTGVTFKEAAEDWMRHGETERGLKPTTIIDYRSALRAHLLPTFGTMRLEDVTARVIEERRAR